MAMNVNKMHAGRPRWHYSATMQLYLRMIIVAQMEAMGIGEDGTPTDEALLARDWFATSELEREFQAECKYISFAKCCDALGLNRDAEALAFLAKIDANCDFDTDECWTRLDYLKSRPLSDDEEPVFAVPEWARVVPAVDQGALWAALPKSEDGARRKKREKQVEPVRVAPIPMPEVAQLGFLM